MKLKQGTTLLKKGAILSSNSYGDFEILEAEHSRNVKIKFENTGFEKIARASDLIKGEVSDPMFPIVSKVGYHGVGPHERRDHNRKQTQAYATWKNMLRRCYTETEKWYHKYGGRGVRVCEEWHNFQNFAEWYNERYFEGCQLDKDLLNKSARLYSPETCVLLPQKINILISPQKRKTSNLPRGVMKNVKNRTETHGRKFKTLIMLDGKFQNLGYFDTAHQAFMKYKTTKEDYIKIVAEEEFEKGHIGEDIRDTLMNWEVYPY